MSPRWLQLVCLCFAGSAAAQGPTYDCNKANGSIEKMICADPELGTLDRTLAVIYAAALRNVTNERPPVLKAEQRGWVKGRNESFWEHQGEATIVWGYQAPEMRCKKAGDT